MCFCDIMLVSESMFRAAGQETSLNRRLFYAQKEAGDQQMKPDGLRYKRVHSGYIVFIEGRQGHAHFKSAGGCLKLMRILRTGKMPNDPYFKRAAKRLLTEDEFAALIVSRKAAYRNHPPKPHAP